MTDQTARRVANAVCELQSRCALLVAGRVECPEDVRREPGDDLGGVCRVTYQGRHEKPGVTPVP